MKKSALDGRDPQLAEVLSRHRAEWAPVFVARATLGCTSVVAVTSEPDAVGSVALLSPAEASALLKGRGDAKGSAKVVGTPPPGTAWALGLKPDGASVWSFAVAPFFGAPEDI